jgi:MFS family permease
VSDRLFTPRFLLMCGFTFTVFLSAFQINPTAPFRILALGGDESVAGMFLGMLTYASAIAAPFTGALADQMGKRRVLVISSVAAALFSAAYAATTSVVVLLAIAAIHGVFWSALITASGAYVADLIPPTRRAAGMGYYGLATVLAIAVAPTLGLAMYRFGWGAVCLSAGVANVAMAIIAYRLPEAPRHDVHHAPLTLAGVFEWRVFVLAVTVFLYAFGYGGVTSFSALYATANGVTPRGLFFMVFAAMAVCSGPLAGRLGDRLGPARMLGPALLCVTAGYAMLAIGGTRPWFIASAMVFGLGFRAAHQFFNAHVLHLVHASRRGAAFGGILAALDIGIGTGSIAIGWIIDRYSFRHAFATAAVLALAAIPYFYLASALIRVDDGAGAGVGAKHV